MRRPHNERVTYYARGRDNALLGLDHRSGFFVARYARAKTTTLDSLAADLQNGTDRPSTITRAWVRGHSAAVMTYTDPRIEVVDRLLRRTRRWRIVAFATGPFVFQIGTWSTTGSPDEDVATSFTYRPPVPWKAAVPATDVAITVPAGWIQARPPIKAAFHAWSTGDPIEAWVYVFHFRGSPVAEEIATATHNISANGGTEVRRSREQLGGRSVAALEFRFPDEGHALPAHDTEWFTSDGNGGSYVLAVGYRSGDPTIGDVIARSWRTTT